MHAASSSYDPFIRGRFPVGVRSYEARDNARNRLFPVEVWYPAAGEITGRDLDPETQDRFSDRGQQRRQSAVRDADASQGTFPLILYSLLQGSTGE
jgi:hypothetical protein